MVVAVPWRRCMRPTLAQPLARTQHAAPLRPALGSEPPQTA